MNINRLPNPNGDVGNWGDILNKYLRTSIGIEGGINVWTTDTRPADPDKNATGVNTTTDMMERFNGTTWEPILNISSVSAAQRIDTGDIVFTVGTVFDGDHFKDADTGGPIFINLSASETASLIKAPLVVTNTVGTNQELTITLKKVSISEVVTNLVTYTVAPNSLANTVIEGTVLPVALNPNDRLFVTITKAPIVLGGFAFTIQNPLIIKN